MLHEIKNDWSVQIEALPDLKGCLEHLDEEFKAVEVLKQRGLHEMLSLVLQAILEQHVIQVLIHDQEELLYPSCILLRTVYLVFLQIEDLPHDLETDLKLVMRGM